MHESKFSELIMSKVNQKLWAKKWKTDIKCYSFPCLYIHLDAVEPLLKDLLKYKRPPQNGQTMWHWLNATVAYL